MKKIAVINQKGGVGKTTILFNLVYKLMNHQNSVLVADLDSQSSLFRLLEKRENEKKSNPDYFSSEIKSFIQKIDTFKKYQYIMIDTIGTSDISILNLCENVDHIIIPMQPSMLDFESSNDLISALKKYGVLQKLKVLFNGVSHQSTNIVKDFKQHLINNDINFFESFICYRKPYKDSILMNNSIFELLNQEGTIYTEFNNFYNEFMEWINNE